MRIGAGSAAEIIYDFITPIPEVINNILISWFLLCMFGGKYIIACFADMKSVT